MGGVDERSAADDFLEWFQVEGVDDGTNDSHPQERNSGGSRRMDPRKKGKGWSEADSGGVRAALCDDPGGNEAGGWSSERCGDLKRREMGVRAGHGIRKSEHVRLGLGVGTSRRGGCGCDQQPGQETRWGE